MEVRAHVRDDSSRHASIPPLESAPTLLFGTAQTVSRADILRQLPSRSSCDKIVTSFFKAMDPALCTSQLAHKTR